jgi:hypothetical protein
MSRRRWIVLLGPPLLVAVAAVPGLAVGTGPNQGAISSLQPRSIATCLPVATSALTGGTGAVPGTWWRTKATIDATGSLESWTLVVGAPGVQASELRIPAASTVTGPVDGRIVVASEEPASEDGSTVRIVDAVGGCATEIRLGERIARRAVADPGRNGLLVHLLEPGSRRDLGIWRLALDGRIAERVLEPVSAATLAAAGIDRVWVTDLRLDAAGRNLAVQSCHPDACVTRIVDLATGDLGVLAREGQGPIVGFSGRQLVTWAACHGLPCPVVAWDVRGGSEHTLALEASGAALSGDGRRLVITRSGAAGEGELVAIDVRTGGARSLGAGAVDDLPLSGAAGVAAGMEIVGASVAIGHVGSIPTPWALEDGATSFTPPDREGQP